jgi:hypothetical protein
VQQSKQDTDLSGNVISLRRAGGPHLCQLHIQLLLLLLLLLRCQCLRAKSQRRTTQELTQRCHFSLSRPHDAAAADAAAAAAAIKQHYVANLELAR